MAFVAFKATFKYSDLLKVKERISKEKFSKKKTQKTLDKQK